MMEREVLANQEKVLITKNFRINQNFLDRALFIPNKSVVESVDVDGNKISRYDDNNGFTIECIKMYGVPSLFDMKVLSCLMSRLDSDGICDVNNINQIMSDLGIIRSGKTWNRIQKSLRIWSKVCVSYNKSFYRRVNNKPVYSTKDFHILSYDINKISENFYNIHIAFDEIFLKVNKDNYSRLVLLNTMLNFESGIAARLYMILDKMFYVSPSWKISYRKLVRKVGMKEATRPKNGIGAIRRALDELNELNQKKSIKMIIKNEILYFNDGNFFEDR